LLWILTFTPAWPTLFRSRRVFNFDKVDLIQLAKSDVRTPIDRQWGNPRFSLRAKLLRLAGLACPANRSATSMGSDKASRAQSFSALDLLARRLGEFFEIAKRAR